MKLSGFFPRRSAAALPRPLSTRLARLLVIALLAFGVVLVVLGAAVDRALHQMSRHDLSVNVDDVREILADQLRTLERNTADFAMGDEIAAHVAKPDSHWFSCHLTDWYREAHGTDLITLLDPQGNVIYSSGGLLAFQTERIVPDLRLAAVSQDRPHYSGLWKWGSYYYLLAGAGIYSSSEVDFAGRPLTGHRGVLVTGIRITGDFISRLERLSHERLELCDLSLPATPRVIGEAAAAPDVTMTLSGHCVLRGIDAVPLAYMRVTSPFPVLHQIRMSFAFTVAIILLLGAAVVFYLVRCMRNWVSHPVTVLRSALERFQAKQPVDWPSLLKSGDEFEQLCAAFGQVTEALNESERTSLRGIIEGSSDAVLVVDGAARIQIANTVARTLLTLDAGEDSASTFLEQLPPEQKALFAEIWAARPSQGTLCREVLILAADSAMEAEIYLVALGDDRLFIRIHDITERKRAESALLASERRYRELADLLMETVFEADAEGRITFFNREGFAAFGYRPEDLKCGLNVLQLIDPEDRPRAQGELNRLRAGETNTCDMELAAVRKDGTLFSVMIEVGAVQSDTGCTGLRGIIIDITEQKQAQAALRESEERFRSLSDSAPVLIWMAGADRHCYYFNRTWRLFTGRSLQVEYGRGWLKNVHPDDLDSCLSVYQNAFSSRRAFSNEYRLKHADGTYHWLLETGTPRFNPDGHFAGFIGTCTDISDRKLTEEALRTSEGRFRALFDGAPDPIFIKDANLRYTHVNAAVERILRLPASRIIGTTDTDLFGPAEAMKINEVDRQVLKGQADEREEQRIIGGELVILHVVKVPLRDREGGISGVCGIVRDVTLRRQTEQALEDERGLFIGGPTVVLKWRAGGSGPVTYVSPNILGQFGYFPDDLTAGRISYQQLIHPEDRAWTQAEAARREAEGALYFELEYRLRHARGDYRWVHDFSMIVRDAAGRVTHHHGYIMDVTERRLAAEALVTSERRYRLLTDNVRDIIWSADPEFRFTYLSSSVTRLTGFSIEAALGKRLDEILTPESLNTMTDLIAAIPFDRVEPARMEELLRTRELEIVCQNGSTLWTEVSMSCIYDEAGRVSEITGVTRDISERKRIEQALLDYATRYRAIVESSPFPLVISRRSDGQILFANERFCRLLKAEAQQVLGTSSTAFYPNPEVRNRLITRLAGEGHAEDVPVSLQRRDGSLLNAQVSARLFRFDGEDCLLSVLKELPDTAAQGPLTAHEHSYSSHYLELLTREVEDALEYAGRCRRLEHRGRPSD